jgi:hypothetical protein
MKCYIDCKVPTVYQLGSISTLMGFWGKLPSGELYARLDFPRIVDAKNWMKQRNWHLLESGAIDELQWKSNKNNIKSFQRIEYDSAVALIRR